MERPDYNSPAALKTFMEAHGLAMQKRFGQNFMVHPDVRGAVLDQLGAGGEVWEVGPGIGSMTCGLLDRGNTVRAFEIDKGFAAVLHQVFAAEEAAGTFKLVMGDVLRTWRAQAGETDCSSVWLFGNLPYNIAATFIGDTIADGRTFRRCVFTVQKEVAERIAARPGAGSYSAFSVLCQWRYRVRAGMVLAPGNFWPRPGVASQVVVLERRDESGGPEPGAFVRLVHALFANRRKTIANNIKAVLPPGADSGAVLASAGINGRGRAEELAPGDFLRLSECVAASRNDGPHPRFGR